MSTCMGLLSFDYAGGVVFNNIIISASDNALPLYHGYSSAETLLWTTTHIMVGPSKRRLNL